MNQKNLVKKNDSLRNRPRGQTWSNLVTPGHLNSMICLDKQLKTCYDIEVRPVESPRITQLK